MWSGTWNKSKKIVTFYTKVWSSFTKPYQLFFGVWYEKSWWIDINIWTKTWFYASKIPLSAVLKMNILSTYFSQLNSRLKYISYSTFFQILDVWILPLMFSNAFPSVFELRWNVVLIMYNIHNPFIFRNYECFGDIFHAS